MPLIVLPLGNKAKKNIWEISWHPAREREKNCSPSDQIIMSASATVSEDEKRIQMNEDGHDFSGVAVHEALFKEVSLAHFSGKYLLMLFYPMDFITIVPSILEKIPHHALDFSRKAEAFRNMNCEILGVSTDSPCVHRAYSLIGPEQGGIGSKDIYLFSDADAELTKAYGIFSEEEYIPYNGAVLLNPKGRVKYIHMCDWPVELNVEEIYRYLVALRVVEESDYTQGTPEYWTPDKKILKLPPGAREFASSHVH